MYQHVVRLQKGIQISMELCWSYLMIQLECTRNTVDKMHKFAATFRGRVAHTNKPPDT